MNPNEYDDEAYTEASVEAHGAFTAAFGKMWAAGADLDDIADVLSNALSEAGVTRVLNDAPAEARLS